MTASPRASEVMKLGSVSASICLAMLSALVGALLSALAGPLLDAGRVSSAAESLIVVAGKGVASGVAGSGFGSGGSTAGWSSSSVLLARFCMGSYSAKWFVDTVGMLRNLSGG